jgi:hypothetical protein
MAEENLEKLEISKDGYLKLISKVYQNKLEERELALDRYRKADEQMETAEQFVLMSKGAVSFLNLASLSSNEMASLAKEIKSIVYKDEMGADVNFKLPDEWKSKISERIDEVEKGRVPRIVENDEEK